MTEDISDILELFIQAQIARLNMSAFKESQIRDSAVHDAKSWAHWYHQQRRDENGWRDSLMRDPKVRRAAQLGAVYEVAREQGRQKALLYKLGLVN